MGPRAGLDNMEKRKFLSYWDLNSNPSVIQPVGSYYTDCATPTNPSEERSFFSGCMKMIP
jgi:hypothetical protein